MNQRSTNTIRNSPVVPSEPEWQLTTTAPAMRHGMTTAPLGVSGLHRPERPPLDHGFTNTPRNP